MHLKKCWSPKDLKVAQLKDYCQWKKQPGNRPVPTKQADLVIRFNETKGNQSPHVSPCNSDVEFDDEDYALMQAPPIMMRWNSEWEVLKIVILMTKEVVTRKRRKEVETRKRVEAKESKLEVFVNRSVHICKS